MPHRKKAPDKNDPVFFFLVPSLFPDTLQRSNDIAFPRQVAMYLCRNVAQMSLPQIGKDFGKRDHTTVMHACTKIENEIKENQNTKLIVESVKNILLSDK